ncbi:MAG: zinc ribbon domain-containing protein [Candidatus Lokiarchaeota archaeon]|nr:zinc ribbon domain-containing protein [Candidatus Lokiarchaeota archaeon]
MTLLKNKVVLIIIQFLILSLMIYGFNHSYQITFSITTPIEQQIIIQYLANYVIFDDIDGMIFIGLIWIIISLLPILIFFDIKKAYSTNLSTFFFLNFFFYVFLFNNDKDVFDIHFPTLITNTLLLGFTIVVVSVGLSIVLKYLKKPWEMKKQEKFSQDNGKSLMVCPQCGTEFQSIPMFCYNCNTKLVNGDDANSEF